MQPWPPEEPQHGTSARVAPAASTAIEPFRVEISLTRPAGGGWLLVERSTPSARAYADHAGEDSGEVALIRKAAGQGHVRQRQSIVAQLLLGKVDATREKPVVRRCSRRNAREK